LEIPLSTLTAVGGRLAALGALIEETTGGDSVWLLRGTVAARRVAELERRLPGLTHGEGVWWSRPAADRPLDHSDRPHQTQRLA
jgi:ribosomal protection tetracycline resistance protein